MSELEAIEPFKIEDMIYETRGVQVMLDSDLAKLYNVETKRINEAVRNNPMKFPDRFCFKLTESETNDLKSKISTSSYGGSRKGHNVFTEQGIAMLATILKSSRATQISICIMDAFVEMRKYISTSLINQKYINSLVLENRNDISMLKQKYTELLPQLNNNKIFYEGQIFDAYVAFKEICDKAKEEIIIIDNYAGKELLKLIKDIKVNIVIITKNINDSDYRKYEKQYSNVEIKYSNKFHDRFIIIDKKELYHCGCSFKDLGEKCFAITKMDEECLINEILTLLEGTTYELL